jgi:aerobic-type carbon monoxide dehydrogenase small subunit (CoxS/CutS family)
MPDRVTFTVNGTRVQVAAGTTVAAAILMSGVNVFRHSISGEPRGPLCGMGICFECRVTVDGRQHVRSCQLFARNGMAVVTT